MTRRRSVSSRRRRVLLASMAHISVSTALTASRPQNVANVASRMRSLSVTEGFESDLASSTGWATGTTAHSWTRRTGRTPTSSTGPSVAHGGLYYMHIETSWPSVQNDVFDLGYTCEQYASTTEVSFYYH
eukprot:613739-Prymnesium_polylepis.1